VSPATSPRMRKVNELMREVIADSVTELEDPGIGFLTITGVDTAPDLRNAIVFYSVLGTDEEKAATAEALERAAPHIQESVAHQVRLKYTPRLSFRVDPAIDEGIKIDQLLRELHEEDEQA
jgi:ribosome-binding factor A